MANEEQLNILRQGVDVWNSWRQKYHSRRIDLSGADLRNRQLSEINLVDADLSGADLTGANFGRAYLVSANLSKADMRVANFVRAVLTSAVLKGAYLRKTDLRDSDLRFADLSHSNMVAAYLVGANLYGANLSNANLYDSDLDDANLEHANLINAILQKARLNHTSFRDANISRADLREVELSGALFVGTKVDKAKISNSSIYGISVWDLDGQFEEQTDLVISQNDKSIVTVDNVKVAQFVHLILNNKEIRDVFDTLTEKAVLILGRFTLPDRKTILDALRNKLREYNLLPIVFDFDRPIDKDFTETIKTLAGISCFVIADITNPKSSPLELQATVPDYQIPFVPIIQEGESPFAMMVDLQKKYPWVLPTRSYDSIETLMKALKPGIIDPAVEMRNKLRLVKAQEQVTESLRDYVDKTL